MPLTKVASSMLASGAAGSGGSTGKNYISSYNNGTCNGDFESGSISGWSVCSVSSITNGLPSGAPTIISSPTASDPALTLLSSGQLAGQYSLQAVFPTTSIREGFISEIFTIDSEDQAKVLTFKFYYNVTSGAANGNFSGTSANTFIVAVYAVNGTNAGWVQPAGLYAMTQSSGGAGIATGTFQTYSDTTQYRFAILCAVAPTPASITVAFDDFQVGPLTAPIGAPVTDWQSYTPTITHDSGGMTNAVTTARYRRVGDSIHVNGIITFSSTSASFSGITVAIPSGLSIDNTKRQSDRLGSGFALDVGLSVFSLNVQYKNSTSVYIYVENSSSTYVSANNIQNTVPFTFNTNDTISFEFFAPITGWSANVQMSNDTDTRVVAASASISSGVSTANTVAFNFDTVAFDSHGAITTGVGTWKFTVPISGYYKVSANLYFGASAGVIALYKNGNIVRAGGVGYGNVGTGLYSSTTNIVQCVAGESLQIVNVSGGSVTPSASTFTGSTVSNTNFVSIERLTGPSVIAATETVAAKYSGSVSATVSTTAPIQWNTKQYDTHNAVTTGANWRFTAPISGIYRVSSTTYTSSGAVALIVAKNGSSTPSAISDINTTQTLSGTTTISLLAGEYIDVRTRTGSATVIAFTEANICIERIGNYA